METIKAEIIIIGGGAAGLMAAAGAAGTYARNGNSGKVVLLEKMPRPGRKIMITGKGRCNFTNMKSWNEFSTHIHPKSSFIKPSFFNLNPERIIEFLKDNGMESIIERGDRAFPASHLASDVVDALVRGAQKSGAIICCGKEVTDVRKEEEGFELSCADGSRYVCNRLIICTGGLSYPKTGSTGDGYHWAKSMGHSIRPLFPSLTAMVPKGYKTMAENDDNVVSTARGHIHRSSSLSELGESLCGNQLKNVGLRLVIDGNEAASEFGDLDFTDGGLEGPIGFKISRKGVNAIINGSKVNTLIDLKPAVEIDELTSRVLTLWDEVSKDKRSKNKMYKDRFRILLGKLMPMSLVTAFLKSNPNADHKTLPKLLKNWKMEIEGYVGYERCVITAGGVSLEEIIPKTLESRMTPGLYLAGEVLDLDADTGGYNLHTAFCTGYLAGISAARQ